MKSFDTEFTKHTKKTRLSSAERNELRERVLTYMEYHPLPQKMRSQKQPHTIRTLVATFTRTYGRASAGAFAALFVLVSIPFAAERAVPGDVLYPVKTSFNENLQAQFANSPYEKISFETQLMERRIAEARMLAKEGRLTTEAEAEIAATVRIHADAAQQGIVQLRAEDIDEATIAEIAFSSALDVQSAVFDAQQGTSSNSTDDIAGAVRDARAAVGAGASTSTPSFDRLRGRIETEIEKAYALLRTTRDAASDAEVVSIEQRLASIERQIQEASNIHTAEIAGSGIPELVAALGDLQKLGSFITDIDVRENVDIETLVPLARSTEERRALADQKLASLQEEWTRIESRIAELEVAEIFAERAIAFEAALDGAVTAQDGEDLAAFEAELNAALVLFVELEMELNDAAKKDSMGTTTDAIEDTEAAE